MTEPPIDAAGPERSEVIAHRAKCGRPDCEAYAMTKRNGQFHRVSCTADGCNLQVTAASTGED